MSKKLNSVFKKNLINVLLLIPAILLLINIYNFLFPTDYRNEQYLINGYISKENRKILYYLSEINRSEILSYKDAIKKIDQQYSIYGESFQFLQEAAKIYFISKAPSNYSWIEKYTKIKFQENWLLFLIRIFEEFQIKNGKKSKYNEAYIFYHSSDYKFALKRGISLCSQDAISFANLLNRRFNISYNIVGLDGHVLIQAKINNKFFLSDPNMGLTFKFNIDDYYENKKYQTIVENTYKKIGQEDLAKHFNKSGNKIFNYTGPRNIENAYNPDTLTFYSNFLKWLLPILFLLIVVSSSN